MHTMVLLLRYLLLIRLPSLHDRRISSSPKFPTLLPSAFPPTLLLSMVLRSFDVSLSPGMPTSALCFGLIYPNLFLLLHRYTTLLSLRPLALQCYPAPVVADGIDSKLPTNSIVLLLIRSSNSAISPFPIFEFGRPNDYCAWLRRILLLLLPAHPSPTGVVSSDLPPHFDRFPICPEFRPTLYLPGRDLVSPVSSPPSNFFVGVSFRTATIPICNSPCLSRISPVASTHRVYLMWYRREHHCRWHMNDMCR